MTERRYLSACCQSSMRTLVAGGLDAVISVNDTIVTTKAVRYRWICNVCGQAAGRYLFPWTAPRGR